MTVEEMNAKYGKPPVTVAKASSGPSELESLWGETAVKPSLGDRLKNEVVAAVKDPKEAAKGFVKGGIKTAVDTSKMVEGFGKEVLERFGGVDTSGLGADPTAVDELTQYSNDAQRGGATAETVAEFVGVGGPKLVKEGVEFAATKSAPFVKPVVETIKRKATEVKDSLSRTGLSKTKDEILATPESQAHKLNTAERDFYKNAQKEKLAKEFEEKGTMTEKEFKAKEAKIEADYNSTMARANVELAENTAKAEKEVAEFSKDVEKVAYDKTIELKPKAREVFSKQSKIYEKLIEEDLAPHVNVKIKPKEISNIIENALPDDPALAEKILDQVGDARTVGELYQALKAVKSKVSKAGKKGTMVMTREDILRDDVAAGLSDLLKEKGVDLTRANDFWRQWKPIQTKINAKLKPFDFADMETKTFADILKRSGDDIHNENFIQEFENVLGESITQEVRMALSKLSKAEKAKIAAKVDAEIQLENAKLAKKYGMEVVSGEKTAAKEVIKSSKNKAEEELKNNQYAVDRLAARRTAVKNVLKAVAGLAGTAAIGVPIYNAVNP